MTEILKTTWSGYDEDKDRLRSEVWSQLKTQGAAQGDPVGHIPRFVGSDRAAERLASLPCWQAATVIKCNPDAVQAPVRRRALADGKQLYMAVPQLKQERCFVALTGSELQQRGITIDVAATNRGAMRHGQLVRFDQMQPIDLVVVGCVAVSRDGGRTGKGAGFADLELSILRQLDLVQADTPIITTVHPLQVVENGLLPMLPHDWSLTWIVTPEEVIETQSQHTQPSGLDWDQLRPQQLKTIPILRKLKSKP